MSDSKSDKKTALTLREWVAERGAVVPGCRASGVEPVALEVVSLSDDLHVAMAGRLADIGAGPGETIFYFGCAPLGEPIYVSIRETVLALRFEEADLLQIRETSSQGPR